MNENKIMSGSIVWVSTGELAYKPDGSHIARVIDIKDNIVSLQHLETRELEYRRIDHIINVCSFPIDEKNLCSDFIDGDFLELASEVDNEYLGWIASYGIFYPLHCKVTKNGQLLVRNISGNPIALRCAKERLIDLFDCDLSNKIVTSKVITDDTMIVTFYSFFN